MAGTDAKYSKAPGPAAPGSGPGGLIPALRRRRRRGAGRQAPVASQGRPAAPATREQGPGGGLSRLPPHLGSLVPMTRGGGKPWLTAAPVLAHSWELGLAGVYNWLHVFEDPYWGLYCIDRGYLVPIPEQGRLGMLNGCSGWLRGADGIWHRQAGYYLLLCASTISRQSFGADLARGQLPVCCCPHGRCCGGAAAALRPAPHPCFRGPQ